MLEFKLTQLDGTTHEKVGSMIRSVIDTLNEFVVRRFHIRRIPLFSDVHDELKSWFEKFQEPFYPSEAVFNKSNNQFTAVYSRSSALVLRSATDSLIFAEIRTICLTTMIPSSLLLLPGQEYWSFS